MQIVQPLIPLQLRFCIAKTIEALKHDNTRDVMVMLKFRGATRLFEKELSQEKSELH